MLNVPDRMYWCISHLQVETGTEWGQSCRAACFIWTKGGDTCWSLHFPCFSLMDFSFVSDNCHFTCHILMSRQLNPNGAAERALDPIASHTVSSPSSWMISSLAASLPPPLSPPPLPSTSTLSFLFGFKANVGDSKKIHQHMNEESI